MDICSPHIRFRHKVGYVDVKYINPFVIATRSVFSTMLHCELTRGALSLADQVLTRYDVSGVIRLSGEASGAVVLSLDRTVAESATRLLLSQDEQPAEEEISDAVGELTNMIAGQAKLKLDRYQLSLSLPTVVTGRDQAIECESSTQPFSIPFDSNWGPLSVEVGLFLAS